MLLTQNTKMKKSGLKHNSRIYNFTLPAYKSETGMLVCPSAGICKSFCYAKKGAYIWPVVRRKHEENLKISLSDNFVDLMSDEIDKLYKLASKSDKKILIRIHDSGDFYNKNYLEKWLAIMLKFPNVTFYAYTKSVYLLKNATVPVNFKFIYSYGGLQDKIINPETDRHSKIFNTEKELLEEKYINASDDDVNAIDPKNHKIGLKIH